MVGLSVGTTLTQDVLRQSLRRRLTGGDVDEVRDPRPVPLLEYVAHAAPVDHYTRARVPCLPWSAGARSTCQGRCCIPGRPPGGFLVQCHPICPDGRQCGVCEGKTAFSVTQIDRTGYGYLVLVY